MSDARKLQLLGITHKSTSIAVLKSEYDQEKSQTADQPKAPNADSHNTIKVKQPALSSSARSMIALLERTPTNNTKHTRIHNDSNNEKNNNIITALERTVA